MSFSQLGEANSASPNPLAKFEGSLQSEGRERKGKKGGEGDRRKRTERTGENSI